MLKNNYITIYLKKLFRFMDFIFIYLDQMCVSDLIGFGPSFLIFSENPFTTSIYLFPSEADIHES